VTLPELYARELERRGHEPDRAQLAAVGQKENRENKIKEIRKKRK